ncbi:hypothetical protein DMUE_0242 [Dictyocoela muelleri]|nr:hypothetical protein DMUE_0242 [Dictyocoela muelleri]
MDNRNLLFKGDMTKRINRWLLMLEKYDYELKYISGENNNEADILSRSFHRKSKLPNRYQGVLTLTCELINKLNNTKDKEKSNGSIEDITEKLRELFTPYTFRKKQNVKYNQGLHKKNLKKIITNICNKCTKCQEEKSYTKTNVMTKFVTETFNRSEAIAI